MSLGSICLFVASCDVAIRNDAPLHFAWESTQNYRLAVHIDTSGSEVLSVEANTDVGRLQMVAIGNGEWATEAHVPGRCTPGFNAVYIVRYRNSFGDILTATDPVGGRYLFWIDNLPSDCSPGTTFVVNHTGDGVDERPGDGYCAIAPKGCTLRAAVMESNALPGPSRILLPPGVIALSLSTGTNRYGIAITDDVSIVGSPGPPGEQNSSVITVDVPARDSAQGYGFPIFRVLAGSVDIANVTMRGAASPYGGTISNEGALSVRHCTIEHSIAGSFGGAIENGGALTVEDSTFRANQAAVGGAILNLGTLIVRGSTFVDNRASEEGGGIFIGQEIPSNLARAYIVNSTFANNQSGSDGGGVFVGDNGSAFLSNVTMTRNRTQGDGGGVATGSGPFGQVSPTRRLVVGHSIVASNTASTWAAADVHGSVTSLGYNLLGICDRRSLQCRLTGVGSNTDLLGSPSLPLDPILLPLADNGGATLTHMPDLASPAVNGGSSSPVNDADSLACPRTDQRGQPRPRDLRCDIGAVER